MSTNQRYQPGSFGSQKRDQLSNLTHGSIDLTPSQLSKPEAGFAQRSSRLLRRFEVVGRISHASRFAPVLVMVLHQWSSSEQGVQSKRHSLSTTALSLCSTIRRRTGCSLTVCCFEGCSGGASIRAASWKSNVHYARVDGGCRVTTEVIKMPIFSRVMIVTCSGMSGRIIPLFGESSFASCVAYVP